MQGMSRRSIIVIVNSPPLIFIVDDDPNFREIFSMKLSSAGFRVVEAEDGAECLEKMKKFKPDLILLDVQMPKMNGIETFLRIKEDRENSDVRVIFLTVLGDPRLDIQEINRRFSKEIGAVGYIRKTDSLDVLLENIQAILQQKSAVN